MTIHSNDGLSGQTKLERISELSAKNKTFVFNNVGHVINMALLREVFHQLDGTKAVGIDKVTKVDYGNNLDTHLENLLKRLRRGTYQPQPARLIEIWYSPSSRQKS